MRPGLQGFTGLYRALVFLMRFAGAAGKPFPSENAPRDQSSREALGGSSPASAVHRGEVKISISRGLVGERDQSPGYAVQRHTKPTPFKLLHSCGYMTSRPTLANVAQHGQCPGPDNSPFQGEGSPPRCQGLEAPPLKGEGLGRESAA